jgi:hypothetical protein
MSFFSLLSLLLLSSIGFSQAQFYYTDSSCGGQQHAHNEYDRNTEDDFSSRVGLGWNSPNWSGSIDPFFYWKVADGLGVMKNLTENATEVSSVV